MHEAATRNADGWWTISVPTQNLFASIEQKAQLKARRDSSLTQVILLWETKKETELSLKRTSDYVMRRRIVADICQS